jgi:hypothetical protein
MPTYEYHCPANGKTIEVWHRMNHSVVSWGELCELASIDPGETQASSPVNRLISGGQLLRSNSEGNSTPTAAASSSCCTPSTCGCS